MRLGGKWGVNGNKPDQIIFWIVIFLYENFEFINFQININSLQANN